jgi:hypothetical protein
MKKYELLTEQLKFIVFLNKNLLKGSKEYDDIIQQTKKIKEDTAKQYLYKTGEGYYELIHTENAFHHCKRILTKDGIEGNKTKELICGAVVCSLMDFVLKPKKPIVDLHHEALEEKLGIEYVEYLESPIQ